LFACFLLKRKAQKKRRMLRGVYNSLKIFDETEFVWQFNVVA